MNTRLDHSAARFCRANFIIIYSLSIFANHSLLTFGQGGAEYEFEIETAWACEGRGAERGGARRRRAAKNDGQARGPLLLGLLGRARPSRGGRAAGESRRRGRRDQLREWLWEETAAVGVADLRRGLPPRPPHPHVVLFIIARRRRTTLGCGNQDLREGC